MQHKGPQVTAQSKPQAQLPTKGAGRTDCKEVLILLQELGYLGSSQQEAAAAALQRVKRS